MKYSKKKIKAIAKMWAAGMVLHCHEDSFPEGFEQSEEVVAEMVKLSIKIAGNYPTLPSLIDIIEYQSNPTTI